MKTKYTANSVEKQLKTAIEGFHARASQAKKDYRAEKAAIKSNERLADIVKQEQTIALTQGIGAQLDSIKGEQEAYVKALQGNIERALLGDQPTDAESVMLRRDAAARVRKITDEDEALSVMRDAIRTGDDGMVHAIGFRGRQSGWPQVLDAYKAAQPESADTASALAVVESLSSDAGYNLANQMNYAMPYGE